MTNFTVNGQPVHYDLAPETPLLWALRDASNLTGTKYGCGTGDCGACIVDIDDRAVPACQIAISAVEGAFVTTIEGLSADRSHPLQRAWLSERVTQCGYCDPGMIMAASVLLKHNKTPSDADIAQAIPNLCRCGTYPRVRAAIQTAAKQMADLAPSTGSEANAATAVSAPTDNASPAQNVK